MCTKPSEFTELKEFITSLLQYDEHNAFLLYVLAQSLWGEGRSDEALATLDRARREDPESGDICKMKAEYLMKLSRYSDAISVLRKASWLYPDDPDILLKMSQCYADIGKYRTAFNIMQRYTQLYMDQLNLDAYNHIGMLYLKARGDGKKAVEFFTMALYLAADRGQEIMVLYNLASSYRFCGEYQKERDIYQEIIKKQPYSSEAWFRLGESSELLGDRETAVKAFRQTVKYEQPEWQEKAKEKLKILGAPLEPGR